MSLLIKALQKAEDEKKSDANTAKEDFSLSLEELPAATSELAAELESGPLFNDEPETQGLAIDASGVKHEVDIVSVAETAPLTNPYSAKVNAEEQKKEANRQAAATLLAAKTTEKNPGSTKKGILLLLVFLALAGFGGIEFYSYLNSLNQPAIVMAKRPDIVPAPTPVQESQPAVATPDNTVAEMPSTPVDVAKAEVVSTVDQAVDKAMIKLDTVVEQAKEKINFEPTKVKAEKPAKPEPMAFGDPVSINPDTSVKVTKNISAGRINPDLTTAYLAFNAGDDTTAQRSYRQVLKNDVRNTDALLGMAAVALHQGRVDDAIGWYGKVLEIEPRNTIAQAAMVSAASQADPVGSESRIKNMIMQQPEAAYLHAALGNIYADQGAWPQAQQAYFQAFHFDPNNAEYAFNLAVSLDQLAKPALALQYYKQALDLARKTGNTNIDRAQLESRISQLN